MNWFYLREVLIAHGNLLLLDSSFNRLGRHHDSDIVLFDYLKSIFESLLNLNLSFNYFGFLVRNLTNLCEALQVNNYLNFIDFKP